MSGRVLQSWNKKIKPLYEEHNKWQRLHNQIVNHRKEHQGSPTNAQELKAAASRATIPLVQIPTAANPQDAANATLEKCISTKKNLKHHIKTETRQLMRKIIQARSKHLLRTYKTNPKTLNRATFTGNNRTTITAVRHHTTGHLHTAPADILQAFHDYHSELLSPKKGKTGKYTADVQRNYPWNMHKAPKDGMTDLTRACNTLQQHECHLDTWNLITFSTTFRNTIQHLANNKAPGPDGIPNELLRCAPDIAHHYLHTLIQCMWHTR